MSGEGDFGRPRSCIYVRVVIWANFSSIAPAHARRQLVLVRAVSPPAITPEVSPAHHGEAGPVGRVLIMINIDVISMLLVGSQLDYGLKVEYCNLKALRMG